MADKDWKKRAGLEINFSSGDEDIDKNKDQHVTTREHSSDSDHKRDFYDDDNLSDFDKYSKTPPRTRILRRTRERKQRNRESISGSSDVVKVMTKSETKLNRRNTISNVYFNELISNADSGDSDQGSGNNRMNKRSLKLLRGSERDLKLDITKARRNQFTNFDLDDERSESLPATTPQPIQVETCNRFMSLTSRPVICPDKKLICNPDQHEGCPENRVNFYKTFSSLIRMGCSERQLDRNPRRHISQEEQLWQNELKDIVWLQLQAWHADRTPTEQDQYLCAARENIGDLLDEIMNYRFQRKSVKSSASQISVQSNDSGMHEINESSKICTEECTGCLSMYCQCCMESQNEALHEIEHLLTRLEAAEALYPSSKSFAQQYPLYKDEKFVGRVKAMCLWYNMTKHHRLKLLILGKLLMFLQNKHYRWPVLSTSTNSTSSGVQTDPEYAPANKINVPLRSTSVESKDLSDRNNCHIQFDVEDTSPSDSNSSNSSSATQNKHIEKDYFTECYPFDYYNTEPIATLSPTNLFKTNTSPYRKYIEDVLKTKGLTKSLCFLERLHRSVLRKAQISLKKPTESTEVDVDSNDDDYELRRYGAWSPEAQALGLPSYQSAFLFLSIVPLEVIHEFLRMRLEQKPDNPSPLSIRQLMREMKEGIRIAILHRQRVLLHMDTVLTSSEIGLDNYKSAVTSFDNSVYEVLKIYLDYLEQWALLNHETFQKSLIEEEWNFVYESSPDIPGGMKLCSEKFCKIISTMLKGIGEHLISRINELLLSLRPITEDSYKKESIFYVFRELQSVFNEEREKTLKTLSFTKTLRKDVLSYLKLKNCEIIPLELLDDVKNSIVELKCSITTSIEDVQNACNLQDMEELDETERSTLYVRCREILHQAYRFGFEFHKEICMFIPNQSRKCLSRSMVQFARLWMQFVKDRCERGRGMRPRWAYQGLDFLMTVCEPCNTIYLTDEEFEDLKNCMDECITHVVGTATPTTEVFYSSSPRPPLDYQRYPRSRGSSPSPRASMRSPLIRPRKISSEQAPHSDYLDIPEKKKETVNGDNLDGNLSSIKKQIAPRYQRVRDSVNRLEMTMDDNLRSNNLIGCIVEKRSEDKIHIRYKRVTFGWQRGIKIGQGRFGKVYTAVNNDTGEMMAMKEIALQHNDHRTIRHVAEEIRIIEGIHHRNLVRYYGIEIHREEMLIFMEFCTEGTLESLVAGTECGLPELLIRKFTYQMLSGITALHTHGIVHRDIKSANIFLTDDGNFLKIGDFGSAVKIKAHVTMPGELQGFVGTQAYMAPEVFMKTSSEGHGRAADIWSMGCVVIEMASGKRPWAEYDSNYQIMFKVGMGETPEVPSSLSNEGHDFIDLCLQHDPNHRATAEELNNHNFVKVAEGD